MTDEKEIAVSVEYAQNTAASLFGDEAVEPTVEAIKEGEPRDESPPDEEGSVVSEEEQAVEAEADAQGDLKVVVSVRRGRATIGVQRPSSDPHIESFDEPDLSGLAHRIADVLGRAKARWEDSPRNPDYARPTTSTGRRPRRNEGSAQDPTSEEADPQQQALRLF